MEQSGQEGVTEVAQLAQIISFPQAKQQGRLRALSRWWNRPPRSHAMAGAGDPGASSSTGLRIYAVNSGPESATRTEADGIILG